jgi:hypothetical protein
MNLKNFFIKKKIIYQIFYLLLFRKELLGNFNLDI